jgi:hypothetical protein
MACYEESFSILYVADVCTSLEAHAFTTCYEIALLFFTEKVCVRLFCSSNRNITGIFQNEIEPLPLKLFCSLISSRPLQITKVSVIVLNTYQIIARETM